MTKVFTQSVQWHITEVCPNRCKHCYIDAATNDERRKQELRFEKLLAILDNLDAFAKKYDTDINAFAITGGDPFEHSDFEKILKELHARGKRIKILGIPERVSVDTIALLEKYHTYSYQVSLDGMEKTHDMIRGRGSFARTIEAIKLLGDCSQIQPHIMYTLHGRNSDELLPIIDYLVKEDIRAYFSFDFCVETGTDKWDLKLLNEATIDNCLKMYREKKIQLKKAGSKLQLKEKVKLFATFDVTNPSEKFNKYSYVSGCSCGINSIAILPNGDVLPCRRLPLVVGNLLKQSYEEVFLDNELMKKLRRLSFFKKCSNCDYAKICRGCPALAYATTDDVFGEMTYCSRKKEVVPYYNEPPLNCERDQEFAYVTNNLLRAIQEDGIAANLDAFKYDIRRNVL